VYTLAEVLIASAKENVSKLVIVSMHWLTSFLRTSAAIVTLCLMASEAMAQNDQTASGGTNQPQQRGRQRPGNFDPAQLQQRMTDRYRERLEITDDTEWNAVRPLIQSVMDARLAAGTGGRGAMGRGPRRGAEGNQTTSVPRPSPARENPAAEELQKAIDAKAPPPEMKAALAKYVESRKAKQANLDKARDALRAVLTSRQEAIATLSGLL
jgi:hypothetical protein